MIKITKNNEILELLIGKELTAIQISSEIGIPKKNIWPKLTILVDNKKIERTNEKKPYKYRAITPKSYLKFLNDFFKDNLDYLMENPKIDNFIEENEEIFNKIEKVINNS